MKYPDKDPATLDDTTGALICERLVFEGDDGVALVDGEGRIVSCNKSFGLMFGHTATSMAGTMMSVLLEGTDIGSWESLAQVLVASEGAMDVAMDIDDADTGTKLRVKGRMADQDHLFTIWQDVSYEGRMRDRLETMEEHDSMGVVVGSIAHDLNNLLMSLKGNLEIISMLEVNDVRPMARIAKAESLVDTIAASARRLVAMGRDRPVFDDEWPIGRIIREATEFTMAGSHLRCAFSLDPELWGSRVPTKYLVPALQNMVLNARQAMQQDDGVVVVTARNVDVVDAALTLGVSIGPYIRVTVTDTGEGISPEELDALLDFRRDPGQFSAGWGLAVWHALLKIHGGVIVGESHEGRGSSLSMYVPASQRRRQLSKTIVYLKKVEG